MIHIKVTRERLIELIELEKKDWIIRALDKYREAISKRKVGEGDGIWSEISLNRQICG